MNLENPELPDEGDPEQSQEYSLPKSEQSNENIRDDAIQRSKMEDEHNETPSIDHMSWQNVQFSFPAPRIRFGKGVSRELPHAIFELLDPMLPYIRKAEITQPKAMIVTGERSIKSSGVLDEILEKCKNNAIETLVYSIGNGEATVDMVDEGVQLALEKKPHYVVGIGGGSVLDVAKSIAGITRNGGLAEEYHEGKPFEVPGLPFIAIPTTAGTGSEITDNAVLIDKARGYKKSIRGNQIMARYILLDPELTLTCPPVVSAHSGVDALVQAIEAYTSRKSHPIADIYAMQAIRLIAPNLRKVVEHGENYATRAEMMLGAFFAGVAFSNVGLGLTHGLAHPIGYKYEIPHGKICGALLPWVIDFNAEKYAAKYAKIAQVINKLDLFTKYEPDCSDVENGRRLVGMIKELFAQVQIPLRLQDLGILKEDFDWIVENTKGRSVNTNLRTPTKEDLYALLEKAW